MIIRSFDDSESGGFDPRNYTPLSYQGIKVIGTAKTYTEVINITGEGFIDCADWYISAGYSKIIVDGVTYTFSGGTHSGFCLDSLLVSDRDGSSGDTGPVAKAPNTSNVVNLFTATTITPFTLQNTDYLGLATSSLPIFFYNSLVFMVSSDPTGTGGYYIRGGLLI